MNLVFHRGAPTNPLPTSPDTIVHLEPDTWNDFGFGTTFDATLTQLGQQHRLGRVKIGSKGLRTNLNDPTQFGTKYVDIPPTFSELSDDHFSLGQDATYYERIVKLLGTQDAHQFLVAMRDLAAIPDLFNLVASEEVVQSSLMRSVSRKSLKRYDAIMSGLIEKQDFDFTFKLRPDDENGPQMRFKVDRSKRLPSNVHVLIGSNGTGKTTTLSALSRTFEKRQDSTEQSPISQADRRQVAGLLSISFSAFDTFPTETRTAEEQLEFRVTNVRLPWLSRVPQEAVTLGTSQASLANERDGIMDRYVRDETLGCLAERSERLLPALKLLSEADPILERHSIATAEGVRELDFSTLSSGHKIAMLMISCLVRYCEERTLVLLDEPESHLHPPLLGAVTRALSGLMTEINGLALVATHSAVVLQEVPRRCAWIIWNNGGLSQVGQPEVETFGANLGLLTREVFDLELSRSGYHALLREVARESSDYDSALIAVGHEIGDEAKMLLRSFLRRQEAEN